MQDRGECIDPAFNCNSCHQLDPAPNDVLLSHNSMEDAIKIKTESKERWLKLPLHPLSHEKHSRQQMGSRPKAFEARPASEVARLFVGGTRSQRQQRLFDAALEGNVERIRALIEAGADIDARNEMGMTPIFISSMYGHLSAVKLLLSAGADLSITSNGGSSCLDAAVAQEHHDVAMLIRTELGCDSPAPNVAPVSPWEAEQPPRASVEILIPSSSNHPGAGAFLVDNAVTRAEMDQLESLFHRLGSGAGFSTENSQYYTCDVERRHFSDSERWVSCLLSLILERAKAVSCLPELTSPGDPLPFMRFLHYNQPMSSMKPHIDLSKKVPDPRGDREKARRRSKYTFLLYLSSGPDDGGGETLLLEREAPTLEACGQVLASIRPIKGRLIVYPHKCPHAGAEVLNPPKILLRGEFY